MVWIYFQELAAQPSHLMDSLDPLPIASESQQRKQYCSPEWQQATFPVPQSGMMFQRYESAIYPISSTSLQADSHVRISALQAVAQAWQASEAAFSGKSCGSLATLETTADSSHGFTWKTCQQSLFEVASMLSEPLPQWGMTVDGALYPLPTLVPATRENAGGFWPTLCARDWKDNGKSPAEKRRDSPTIPTKIGGKVNPLWAEWLMGYPIGHTEYKAWAMPGYRNKLEPRLES